MPYTTASGVEIPTGTDAFSPTAQLKTMGDKLATYDNRVVVALDTDRTALASPVLRDGLQCYVTGTDKTWLYEGTTWRIIIEDTGWITPTLLNSWTAVPGAGFAVGYRRHNGVVHIKGRVTGGSTGPIFNLPAGFRTNTIAFYTPQNGSVVGSVTQLGLNGSAVGNIDGIAGSVPFLSAIPPFIAEA